MKYHPSLDAARAWVTVFTHWYNNEHKHSGIRYVTPQQRHIGQDLEIFNQRKQVYLKTKLMNPARWSKGIRDWSYINEVLLNPENDIVSMFV